MIKTRWSSILARVIRSTTILLPLVLLSIMLTINPTLRHPATWDRIGRNWAGIGVLAIGMTPIIVTGGIDLSVGSVVALSGVISSVLYIGAGLSIEMALLLGGCAAIAAGAFNGILTIVGINPLVGTLAMMAVYRGLAYGLHGSRAVTTDFPEGLQRWWEAAWLGIPNPVWLLTGVFGVMYIFLHHTWMGRMLYAIGDNVEAARYAGVPVRMLVFSLYVLSGMLAGIVGLSAACEFRSAPPSQGEGLELQAIACVVLGGTRITGGSGHLAGTLLGTLTLASLLEGLVWVPARWRLVVTGVFLVAIAIANESLARLLVRLESNLKN